MKSCGGGSPHKWLNQKRVVLKKYTLAEWSNSPVNHPGDQQDGRITWWKGWNGRQYRRDLPDVLCRWLEAPILGVMIERAHPRGCHCLDDELVLEITATCVMMTCLMRLRQCVWWCAFCLIMQIAVNSLQARPKNAKIAIRLQIVLLIVWYGSQNLAQIQYPNLDDH